MLSGHWVDPYYQQSEEVKEMKGRSLSLLIVMLVIICGSGCSGKPAQELAAAKSAVDVASSEGAEKYAPEEAKKVYDALTAAQQEIKTQEGKFLKNYTQAREMLTAVKADAENLRSILPTKKENLRKKSLVSLEAATSAFNGSRAILAQVPRAKVQEDLFDSLENDLIVLEGDLTEAQELIAHEDYAAAARKADTVRDRSVLLAEQIRQSFDKVTFRDKKAGPN